MKRQRGHTLIVAESDFTTCLSSTCNECTADSSTDCPSLAGYRESSEGRNHMSKPAVKSLKTLNPRTHNEEPQNDLKNQHLYCNRNSVLSVTPTEFFFTSCIKAAIQEKK
jgi:hypothetical protein